LGLLLSIFHISLPIDHCGRLNYAYIVAGSLVSIMYKILRKWNYGDPTQTLYPGNTYVNKPVDMTDRELEEAIKNKAIEVV